MCKNKVVRFAVKKDSYRSLSFFGEGILLLMGCSKKLYNVLGGYEYYYIRSLSKSVHKQ